jgi:hypothetical protein
MSFSRGRQRAIFCRQVPPEFWVELKRQNLIEQNAFTPTAA